MKKIQENFYYIQNSRMENNSFILINKNFCFIIDPSWNGEELISFIKTNNLLLKGVILTHLHADHVGDTRKILKEFNTNEVYVSKNGTEIVENTSNRIFIHDKEFKNLNINFVEDNFEIENGMIKFIWTPGHSKCSMCIHYKDFIITGDHIFIEDIGRTDLDYSNPKDMELSLIKIKEIIIKNKIKNIMPGHGDFDTIINLFKKNKYIS